MLTESTSLNTPLEELEAEESTDNGSMKRPKRWRRILSILTGFVSLYLLVSIVSHFFTGTEDQSLVDEIRNSYSNKPTAAANWTGKTGAWLSHFLVYEWLGLCALFLPLCTGIGAYNLYYPQRAYNLRPMLLSGLLTLFWVSIFLGFLALTEVGGPIMHTISGGMGHELAYLLSIPFGKALPFVLLIVLLLGVFYYLDMPIRSLFRLSKQKTYIDLDNFSDTKSSLQETSSNKVQTEDEDREDKLEDSLGESIESKEVENSKKIAHLSEEKTNIEEDLPLVSVPPTLPEFEIELPHSQTANLSEVPTDSQVPNSDDELSSTIDFEIDESYELSSVDTSSNDLEDSLSSKDELLSYRLPPLSLLQEKEVQRVHINKDELAQNKDKIIETLTNFRISISSIKATVGPTVTLYEIVPAAGVRISKIKNLEDDIALSLSALGIRIIAPMPGKGTIGIEVPNKVRELTLLRTALSSSAFRESKHVLPIVLGKDVSGEVQVVDLVKMPHILMAGATGQGKSVGLNVMLSSLLYKKRPNELKLVLVDPKKVELSLFSCIEQHFLAKLPESEAAIITDTQKVVHTLISLCQEMDTRYELLKEASCRNIGEYNEKYKLSQLPKEKKYQFLPYIVLVIDELADLMMTAGKEVEAPIARLAQLARAIGIHLIVATQRPSVNVITGIIKANFPARISYRVTSQVDSRTILDARGAEQLVGSGDMLFSTGSEHRRLQCPFVDTQEVEAVCEYIGRQSSPNQPYLLPEVEEEGRSERSLEVEDRDTLFEEAANLIVRYGQGSASLIQRKLGVGFNRAGRLIDQMEVVGIVGAARGSKPREVLVQDEIALQSILKKLNE